MLTTKDKSFQQEVTEQIQEYMNSPDFVLTQRQLSPGSCYIIFSDEKKPNHWCNTLCLTTDSFVCVTRVLSAEDAKHFSDDQLEQCIGYKEIPPAELAYRVIHSGHWQTPERFMDHLKQTLQGDSEPLPDPHMPKYG